MAEQLIGVEVAFALPDKQMIITLEVNEGTTAQQAVEQSNIQQHFPEEKVVGADLGIFGKSVKGSYVLSPGDRVEVYRALLADPKEVRKRRAAEAKAKRAEEKGNK